MEGEEKLQSGMREIFQDSENVLCCNCGAGCITAYISKSLSNSTCKIDEFHFM